MMGFNACANAQNSNFTDMDPDSFSNYLAKKEIQLLDVRTPAEYSEGHLAGAKNIDWYDDNFIIDALKSLDRSKPVAIYCRSGKRSAEAARKLAEQGYHVTNLKGGIMAWGKENKPIVKR